LANQNPSGNSYSLKLLRLSTNRIEQPYATIAQIVNNELITIKLIRQYSELADRVSGIFAMKLELSYFDKFNRVQ